MPKPLTLSLAALAALTSLPASAALGMGALAFTGFNADQDNWALVALERIDANTQIYFSDNEWNGSAFADLNEHSLLWHSGASDIAAGTVVLFTEIDVVGGPDVITASHGTLALAAGGGSNLGLSASGETLYAYLGSSAVAPTTFLAAISTEATAANMTAAGLVVGASAIRIATGADFGEYIGSRAGQASFAAYAPLVNDAALWSTMDGGDFATLVPNTAVFAVPEPQTYALMLAGLGALGLLARRRRG
jgi:PEP-CTERM motif